MFGGQPCLADFGYGRLSDELCGLTTGGMPFTKAYRAPEILSGRSLKPTMKADIYAFGCVMIEASATSALLFHEELIMISFTGAHWATAVSVSQRQGDRRSD